MYHKILLITIFFFVITTANATEYYGDLYFNVNSQGTTNITGTTNHPLLQEKTTQEYTSKNMENWTFTINTQEIFSEYIYEITLPEKAELTKINTTDNYTTSTQNNRLIITGIGKNKSLVIEIKYIIPIQNEKNYFNETTIVIILAIMLAAGLLLGVMIFNKNKNKKIFSYNKEALTQRQLEIVKLVETGTNTQAELQKKLGYPKSSLSRNLDSLEKKGIIKKERKGMTMFVSFEEKK